MNNEELIRALLKRLGLEGQADTPGNNVHMGELADRARTTLESVRALERIARARANGEGK